VEKQLCCARNNGRAFLWLRDGDLRTSTDITRVCVGIHSSADVYLATDSFWLED
jgi:hypothetical protein